MLLRELALRLNRIQQTRIKRRKKHFISIISEPHKNKRSHTVASIPTTVLNQWMSVTVLTVLKIALSNPFSHVQRIQCDLLNCSFIELIIKG